MEHTHRGWSALALVLVVALGLVLLPGAALADEPELPEHLEVEYGDDVSVTTQWYVDTAVRRAWEYFAPLIPDPEGFEALVVVVTNPEDAVAVWAKERRVSIERARQLFTARSGSYAGLAVTGLTVIINDHNATAGATVHEVAHLVQHHVAGRSQGPRWLSEGAAEYFSMLIEADWGIDTETEPPQVANRTVAEEWAATTRNCATGRLPAGGETCLWATESLSNLERGNAFDIGGGAVSAYSRAALAFQLLVDRYGVPAYFCYLEQQGSGSSWRTAFRDCFDGEVNDYYRYFEQARSRGFTIGPRNRLPQML